MATDTFKDYLERHACKSSYYNDFKNRMECGRFKKGLHSLVLCTVSEALCNTYSCEITDHMDLDKPYLCRQCIVSDGSIKCKITDKECPDGYSATYSRSTCSEAVLFDMATLTSKLAAGCAHAMIGDLDPYDIRCTAFNPAKTCSLEMACRYTADTCPEMKKFKDKLCSNYDLLTCGGGCKDNDIMCHISYASAYTPSTCPALAEHKRYLRTSVKGKGLSWWKTIFRKCKNES